MPKKPSLTKQIGEALGTENKAEQLNRISRLVDFAQSPVLAVTVLYHQTGEVFLSVVSPFQISSAQMKTVLQAAVDRITEMEVTEKFHSAILEDAPPSTEDPPDEEK
jgi:hypothetical protein